MSAAVRIKGPEAQEAQGGSLDTIVHKAASIPGCPDPCVLSAGDMVPYNGH